MTECHRVTRKLAALLAPSCLRYHGTKHLLFVLIHLQYSGQRHRGPSMHDIFRGWEGGAMY